MFGGSLRGIDRLVAVLVVLTVFVGLTAVAGGSHGIGPPHAIESPQPLFADDEGEPPLADAGLDQHAQINETVYLDAGGSYAPDSEIESYEWTIEAPDDTHFQPDPHDEVQTTFVPEQMGTYNVTVTVTATNGLESTDTLFVEVTDREPPSASLDGPEIIDVDDSATLELDASPGSHPLMSVSWYVDGAIEDSEFLDGDGPWERSVSFDQPGEYTLTAEVIDESGLTAIATHDLTVLGEAPFFDVEISNTNSPVPANAPLQATIVVENTGEEPDTQDVVVQTNEGHVLASFDGVSLDSGESTTRSATLEPCLDTDIEGVSVHSNDDSDEQAITVNSSPCAEAFFAVSIDDVSLSEDDDTELEVDATVENVGEVADTQDVRLDIDQVDGIRDQADGVSLVPGHSESVTLELERSDQYDAPYELAVSSEDDVATETFEYGKVVEDNFVVIHESDEWFGQGPAEGETIYMHEGLETQIGVGVGEATAEWEDAFVDRTQDEPDSFEHDWIDSEGAWQQTGLIENNWEATEYLYRTPTVREDGEDAYNEMPHIGVELGAETGIYEDFCVIGYPDLNADGPRPSVGMESPQDHWYTEHWADPDDGPFLLEADCVEVGIIEEEEYDEMMGADLEVEVVNVEESPLSDADVWSHDGDGFSGTTGSDGTVEFEELDDETTYLVEAEYDGESASEEILIDDGAEEYELTIGLSIEPTGTLELTVMDDVVDEPVEGATVLVDGELEDTDSSGEVEMEVSTGSHEVEVYGDSDSTTEWVTIEDGETTEETVYLEETTEGDVRFAVVDQNHDAVEGAEVSIDGQTGLTNHWGEVVFEGVDEGYQTYEIDYNGITETGGITVQAGNEVSTTETLNLVGSLEVTVMDYDTGERVEGVEVYETNNEFFGTTDSDGEVLWDDIDEGSYDVYVGDNLRSVEIEAGETTNLNQYVVRRGTLEVHVVDQYENDISGAEVEEDVSWFEDPGFSGETNWDGEVEFEIPPDSYDIIARYDGEETTQVDVVVYDDETTEITMMIWIDYGTFP